MWFLYHHLSTELNGTNPFLIEFRSLIWFIPALLLMPINWILEAKKWQILVKEFASLPLGISLKAVLIGVFYTMFTPNRIGDGAGRLHHLPPGNKTRAVYAFGLGSGAQLLSTMIFGLIGLSYFLLFQPEPWLNTIMGIVLAVVILGGLFLYMTSFRKIRKGRAESEGFLASRIATLQQYDTKTKWQILGLSMLRYTVFTVQFLCCLWAIQPELPCASTLTRISSVYLGSTIIPSFALAEIGLRESVAIVIFQESLLSAHEVFVGTLLIWLINLLVPALFGGNFFLRSKSNAT